VSVVSCTGYTEMGGDVVSTLAENSRKWCGGVLVFACAVLRRAESDVSREKESSRSASEMKEGAVRSLASRKSLVISRRASVTTIATLASVGVRDFTAV
jgi:hypothetical protein